MQHRKLGSSGLMVAELTYGTWLQHTEGEALRMARAALELGYTTFDTADVYGATRTESVLGIALQGVRRESYVLSTKVFARVGPGANDRGLSRKHIREACEASLRRLGVEYIDIYNAHRFDSNVPLVETLRAFDDLIRQGKILYVGVSEWTGPQISNALQIADSLGLDRLVANQVQYSLLWRPVEAEVSEVCAREGLGQMAWSPLAQGLLSGKYLPGREIPREYRAGGTFGSQFARRGLTAKVLERIADFGQLARDAGMTTAQLSLAWLLTRPTVSTVVIGASREEQLRENIGASGLSIDVELESAIDCLFDDIVERRADLIPSEPWDYGKGLEK